MVFGDLSHHYQNSDDISQVIDDMFYLDNLQLTPKDRIQILGF